VQTRLIALVATRCRTCGTVGVYWNGALVKKVSQYASSTARRSGIGVTTFTGVRAGLVSLRSLTNRKTVQVDGLALSRGPLTVKVRWLPQVLRCDAEAPWMRDLPIAPAIERITDRAGQERLRDRLARSERVLVLTGAGLGAGSGLPTFRGAGGVYQDDGIADFHHAAKLPGSLSQLWAFWGPFRAVIGRAEPNEGHRALAAWQRRVLAGGRELTLVTQNVDDLHERAGATAVEHLHGDLFGTRCAEPACPYALTGDTAAYPSVPSCPTCGGPLRPDMVLFGEPVNLDAQWAAKRAVRSCDTFLAVGTSGTVAPANGLVRYASDVGALTVCVDPSGTVSPLFRYHVALPAEEVLPVLLR
jgi:NAD-dependent protein deacetylase/lipoamidase